MRVARAMACVWVLAGCGATPEPSDTADPKPASMTDIRLGACAPVRYRELQRDAKPPEPPKPRVIARIDLPSYQRQTFRQALKRQLEDLEPVLSRCFKPADFSGSRSRTRVSVAIYQSPSGRVTRVSAYSSGNRLASRCIEQRLRAEIRQLPPAGRTTGRAYMTFSMSRPTTPRQPDRIQLVDGRDRVAASLKLAGAVAAKSEQLTRCVRAAALPRPGRLAATLLIEKGVVTTTDVAAPDELAACSASALTEIDLGDIEIGGTFECAAGYGLDRPARPRFAVEVGAGAITVASGEPIDAALIREQRPPAGDLYKQLSERRFAGDGGRYSALRLADDARGSLIVRAAEAESAADIAIASIEVRRGDDWTPVAELSHMPVPRLSRVAAQSAGPVVIATTGALWSGIGRGHHDRELEAGDLAGLDKHLADLRAVPGISHRADAIIGVGPEITGAALAAVVEHVARSGFDQIELVDAETARARLAQ